MVRLVTERSHHCRLAGPKWILAQFQQLTAVGSAIIHDAADELFRCRSRASTSMRSAHLKQDRFDASPIAGPFAFASLFKTSGLLSCLSDGLESVGFPELPRVVVYFRGLHGIVLLFFSTTASGQSCMEAVGFDTPSDGLFYIPKRLDSNGVSGPDSGHAVGWTAKPAGAVL